MDVSFHIITVRADRLLADRTHLCHFHLRVELPLETSIQDLPLRWFKTVDHTWQTSQIVGVREVDHFLIDKLFKTYDISVDAKVLVVLVGYPLSTVRRSFLIEDHIKRFAIGIRLPAERPHVLVKISKIFSGFGASVRSETFVILHREALSFRATKRVSPNPVFRHGVEGESLLRSPLIRFKQRSDE